MSNDEKRTCPHCGKALRSDNTKGVCSPCQSRGRTLDNAPSEPVARRGGKSKASETMKSFRQVASGLGMDPDDILEEAVTAWLDSVRKAVQ